MCQRFSSLSAQARLIGTQKELQAARGELREALERAPQPVGLLMGTPGEAWELQRAIDREKELLGELRGLQRLHNQLQQECERLREEHALMQEQVGVVKCIVYELHVHRVGRINFCTSRWKNAQVPTCSVYKVCRWITLLLALRAPA